MVACKGWRTGVGGFGAAFWSWIDGFMAGVRGFGVGVKGFGDGVRSFGVRV